MPGLGGGSGGGGAANGAGRGVHTFESSPDAQEKKKSEDRSERTLSDFDLLAKGLAADPRRLSRRESTLDLDDYFVS